MARNSAEQKQYEITRETRVFISYSRKDGAIADRIRDALIEHDFESYLDKYDIMPGEPWQERLGGLIGSADTVVFCLSPNFVASKTCDWEVNEAERIGKRLLPVVIQDTPDQDTPGRLKRLNYFFIRSDTEFAEGLNNLITTLNTDIDWIREQTRLAERAKEWITHQKAEGRLLRDDDISRAEGWVGKRPQDTPVISEAISKFITASRRASIARDKRARRRNRFITVLSLLAMYIMASLSWYMYDQWQDGLRS